MTTEQIMKHLTLDELNAGLPHVQQSPQNGGTVEMIVARPAEDARKEMETAVLDTTTGLQDDNWQQRGSKRTADGSAHPDMQITLMNSRAAQLIAQSRSRWALAGDQLFVDLDLSPENLPPGQKLQLGTAVLQITTAEHRGCLKFATRFGHPAHKFVNQDGWPQRLRGIYAKVIQTGTISVGDAISKIE